MTFLKVAASPSVQQGFTTQLDVVDVQGADLAGIGAVVASTADAAKAVEQVEATGFGIPVFVALQPGESVPESLLTFLFSYPDNLTCSNSFFTFSLIKEPP